MQQQAEADAARRAAEEYAALNAHRMGQQSSDNIPPELAEDEQTKQNVWLKTRLLHKKLQQQKLEQQKPKFQLILPKQAEQKAAEEKRKLEEKRKAEEAHKAAEAKRKAEEEHKAAERKRS